jgi:hypothetical protein
MSNVRELQNMAFPVEGAQETSQAKALYEAIGRFVVEFEQACHEIQICVVFILWKAGLHDQRVSQIVIAGMTAEPLRTLFESLVGQQVPLNEIEKKMVKNAISRFQKLTSDRNDVIHTTWNIGWGDGTYDDFSTASGSKFHKNKDGAAAKSFENKAEDFALLTQEARELHDVFQRLNGCFVAGFSVEKNFVFLPNGLVSVPPGVGNVYR